MKIVQQQRCFEGEQRIYEAQSHTLKGLTRFSVYLPPRALAGQACPAVIYLAGLTCNEETFAIKAHAQRLAAQLNLIIFMPDTSPRGEGVADDEAWDLGQAAGFYINATQQPWSAHFHMESFIVDEFYTWMLNNFPVQQKHVGIFGHSMGGHGALTLALKYPEKFKSVSAFAPICAPSQCPWGEKAFSHYLGDDQALWQQHDATALIQQKGAQFRDILIDQGLNDQFYSQLNPALFQHACATVGQSLSLREHEGYDHGYYFIQSFIDDHLQFHATELSD